MHYHETGMFLYISNFKLKLCIMHNSDCKICTGTSKKIEYHEKGQYFCLISESETHILFITQSEIFQAFIS